MMDHRRDAGRGSTAPATTHASLPADRAFVVQIRADADLSRGDVRGRIEHVTSGSVTVFESLEQLLGSMRAAVAGTKSFVNEGEK